MKTYIIIHLIVIFLIIGIPLIVISKKKTEEKKNTFVFVAFIYGAIALISTVSFFINMGTGAYDHYTYYFGLYALFFILGLIISIVGAV